MNDNRNYYYKPSSITNRSEFTDIARLIKKESKVIDLACGDGSLLYRLREEKYLKRIDGIDISKSAAVSAKRKGINVKVGRIDIPLSYIKDKTYDYSICNVTLQMVMYPEIVIQEMCRISEYQIISFPNFAFFPNRLEMLMTGRMPKLMLFGYKWYSTGEIHQLSIADFENYCYENNIKITERIYKIPANTILPKGLHKYFPNFCALIGIYLLNGKIIK